MTERNPGDRAAIISGLGLTIDSKFIPFSQSRNKDEKSPSLNWLVSIKKDGRPILETFYSAGCAHAPSYKQTFGRRTLADRDRDAKVAWECQNGREAGRFVNTDRPSHMPATLQPDALDVLASLAMDSDVIDAGGFESWAGDLGYDVDSRKAETIYRACLDIALKLRAALGDSGLQTLRNAFEGY